MESENLNSCSPESEEFDAECRAIFSAPDLPDDGFSNRVLVALPVAADRAYELRRRWFCAAGSVAGGAITALGLIISNGSSPLLPQLANGVAGAAVQFVSGPALLALGLTAFSLWFAFRDRWRLIPRW